MELHAGVAFTMYVHTTLGFSSMTSILRKRAAGSSCASTTQVIQQKTEITLLKKGKALRLTFYKGYSTYSVTPPLPYAVRVFTEGIVASLETFNHPLLDLL